MNLTSTQRRSLALAQAFRVGGPTIGALLRPHALYYTRVFVFGLIVSVGLHAVGYRVLAAFVAGLLVGAAARTLGHARSYVRMWPLTERITHWQEVAALLAPDRGTASVTDASVPNPAETPLA